MKRYLLILLVTFFLGLVVLLPGCSKYEGVDQPTTVTNYQLRFTNTSNNPYMVDVNGTSTVLTGNTYKNYTLKKGTYAWQVTQQSGYALFPTVKDGTITLNQDKEVVFP